jgi:transcriptional regulator with PAS, ATPase and Fis domain
MNQIKSRFGIVGSSQVLDRALETAMKVAPTDMSVLITGESGVGKEVFSKIIHASSARKHNDFIAVNCGAIPEGTINSELFGHEKGAFTGAVADRKGYFETVNGGTIFLDEIGEMPLDTQAFLLRVLENQEFIRVGSSKVEKTNVRVIAATNVDLEDRVRKGKFREDLFYRLNTVPIKVPSLKERREDISVLFRKFVHDISEKYRMSPIRLDDRATSVLENYRWPGNIRELKNVAEQLSILSENRQIDVDILQEFMPHLFARTLPVITDKNGYSSGNGDFQERELLYKLLFDMKNDLNDLKSMFFELVKSNNLRMPDLTTFNRSSNVPVLPASHYNNDNDTLVEQDYYYGNNAQSNYFPQDDLGRSKPMIIDTKSKNQFEQIEAAESMLAMDEIEKDAIKRALKKYNGRRKEAAEELKISERTLYRKIKEYDI